MRGLIYFGRKKRLLGMTAVLAVICFFNFYDLHWMKEFAEEKVSEFMGHKLAVRIGDISGGVFRDMVLQNVAFTSGSGGGEKVFRLERMEISYRVWRPLLEKLDLMPEGERPLKYVGVYFSKENPFLRGFLKLYSSSERIEVFGHVSPALFDDQKKRGIKGVFARRQDGRYDCDLLWDGRLKVTGVLDPSGQKIELVFKTLSEKKGLVKICAVIDENEGISVYSRLDKVNIFGVEIIGDLKASYRDRELPLFSFEAENLVVNKRSFWGFTVEGGFSAEEKTVFLDNVKWGEAFTLVGKIETAAPYVASMRLLASDADLAKLSGMFGNTNVPLAGSLEAKIDFEGPVGTSDVKGRLYIGEGVIGNLEFCSISAALEGTLPLIRIINSRIMKEGGHIIVDGEVDFSKLRENKALDGVSFVTDNKVAVWEEWQISKTDESNTVKARKDNLILTTAMEDDGLQAVPAAKAPMQKDVGFEYKLDISNSIKADFEENKDFFGLQHKIQF